MKRKTVAKVKSFRAARADNVEGHKAQGRRGAALPHADARTCALALLLPSMWAQGCLPLKTVAGAGGGGSEVEMKKNALANISRW